MRRGGGNCSPTSIPFLNWDCICQKASHCRTRSASGQRRSLIACQSSPEEGIVQGLLLPLCQSGSCTLREAVIVSSVINRTSIPVVHSAAALLRLAEMPYSGTTSFFIRVLLDKKYSMPYRVVSHLQLSNVNKYCFSSEMCH